MAKTSSRIHPVLLSGIFAIAAYGFWAIPYRSMLSYHEQLQLFLLDGDYLAGLLQRPGGMAVWIGEFLTQFFNNYWIGAGVVAALLVAMQLLGYALICKVSKPSLANCLLSFGTPVGMWLCMGDANVMTAFAVAILMAIAAALCFSLVRTSAWQIAYMAIAIPAFYWLFGPAVYLLAVLMGIMLIAQGENRAFGIGALCFMLVYAALIVYASSFVANYQLSQLMVGVGYYRMPLVLTAMQAMVGAVCVVSVLIPACRVPRLSWAAVWILAILAAFSFPANFGLKEHEIIDYDYLVRTNNWNGIIAKAQKQQPDMPLTVAATNLALGMTGQLSNRAFDFYQNGAEGLLPPFKKETLSSLLNSEIYYQLGLVNTAQRMCFEGMEAIPNYNKSVRCIKRLAETALIRGDEQVADKYLRLLEKTMFYKKWAQRQRAGELRQPYAKIKAQMIDDDYLFSEPEVDKILGQLCMANPSNQLAEQYLMLYPLLQRDLNKFMQYMQVVSPNHPPKQRIAQEAVAFALVNSGQEIPAGMIDPAVVNRLKAFARVWSKDKKASELEQFSNTVWYYLAQAE